MNKLGVTARAWLKGTHVLASGIWVGAVACMLLVNVMARPGSGSEWHGMVTVLTLIDDWVVVPSAVGSLLTGFLISWLTPWGFFKWRWVTVKWVLTIVLILVGTFLLKPVLTEVEALAAAAAAGALQTLDLLSGRRVLVLSGMAMVTTLIFLMYISVFKPWKRPRQAGAARGGDPLVHK